MTGQPPTQPGKPATRHPSGGQAQPSGKPSTRPAGKPCRACGREIPQQAQTCAHCGATQAPVEAGPGADLRPLGGEPPELPSERPPPPRQPTPPPPEASSPPPAAGARPSGERAETSGTQRRQSETTLWEFVQDQWKADRWFAVLLGMIVLGAVLSLLRGNLFGVIIYGIVLWGLLNYSFWIYILMLLGVGFATLSGGLALITGALSVTALPELAVNAFIFVVLLRRHEQYL